MKTILRTFVLLFCVASFAQTTVKGTVNDDGGLPLPGANIIIVGTSTGVVTDFDGNFTLEVSQTPPFSVQVSSVGFQSQTSEITSNNQTLSVVLEEGSFLDEVVVSASRVPHASGVKVYVVVSVLSIAAIVFAPLTFQLPISWLKTSNCKCASNFIVAMCSSV